MKVISSTWLLRRDEQRATGNKGATNRPDYAQDNRLYESVLGGEGRQRRVLSI